MKKNLFLYKNSALLNQDKILRKLENKIMHKFSKKYNSHCNSKFKYNELILQNLLYNKNSHLVSKFKDYMIYDFVDEFLKRFYFLSESQDRLPKFAKFYYNYLKFFCLPIFTDFYANNLIQNCSEKKAELFYKENIRKKNRDNSEKDIGILEDSENNKNNDNISKSKIDKTIFKNSIRKEIEKNFYNDISISLKNDSKIDDSGLLLTQSNNEYSLVNIVKGMNKNIYSDIISPIRKNINKNINSNNNKNNELFIKIGSIKKYNRNNNNKNKKFKIPIEYNFSQHHQKKENINCKKNNNENILSKNKNNESVKIIKTFNNINNDHKLNNLNNRKIIYRNNNNLNARNQIEINSINMQSINSPSSNKNKNKNSSYSNIYNNHFVNNNCTNIKSSSTTFLSNINKNKLKFNGFEKMNNQFSRHDQKITILDTKNEETISYNSKNLYVSKKDNNRFIKFKKSKTNQIKSINREFSYKKLNYNSYIRNKNYAAKLLQARSISNYNKRNIKRNLSVNLKKSASTANIPKTDPFKNISLLSNNCNNNSGQLKNMNENNNLIYMLSGNNKETYFNDFQKNPTRNKIMQKSKSLYNKNNYLSYTNLPRTPKVNNINKPIQNVNININNQININNHQQLYEFVKLNNKLLKGITKKSENNVSRNKNKNSEINFMNSMTSYLNKLQKNNNNSNILKNLKQILNKSNFKIGRNNCGKLKESNTQKNFQCKNIKKNFSIKKGNLFYNCRK